MTDPLRRGPGFRAPSHFWGKSPPGGDHFPSAHRGRFRAIFLIVFGDGFVGAHLNCEGVNFGPAAWRHARSGLGAPFEPTKSRVFEAKLTELEGQ